ncbi:MAG: YggT family protein [Asticcacaulis sp.]|nr:YggT family protein [Asticcacaulis sp.]
MLVVQLIFEIVNACFLFILFALFCSMVLNWLVFFNVISTRNSTIWRIQDLLDRITGPILEPFRRIIPSAGGFDLSFLVAVIVIGFIQRKLLPLAEYNLIQLLSGG